MYRRPVSSIMLQFIFVILLSFEGSSIHSGDRSVAMPERDFNSEHHLMGVEYRNENVSISYLEFFNSWYLKSKMLKFNYFFQSTGYGTFGFTTFKTTGYEYAYGTLPIVRWDYKNVELELTAVPPVPGKAIWAVILTKKVKF